VDSKVDTIYQLLRFALRLDGDFGRRGSINANETATVNIDDWAQHAELLRLSVLDIDDSQTLQGDDDSDKFKEVDDWIKQMDVDVSDDEESPAEDGDLIPFWIQRSKELVDNKQYEQAIPFLQKTLKQSYKIYGPQFEQRENVLRMLGSACIHSGRWDEADKVWQETFAGRDVLMENLASELLNQGRHDDAWRICAGKEFEGRMPILDSLATSFYQAHKWDLAKEVLLILVEADSNNPKRMHTLAEICLALGQLKEARKWCVKAMEERKEMLGQQDPLYYQSVSLLAEIYYESGDSVHGDGYKHKLPSDFFGK
jgi:tetratricopeptide (TPR) repeat protein